MFGFLVTSCEKRQYGISHFSPAGQATLPNGLSVPEGTDGHMVDYASLGWLDRLSVKAHSMTYRVPPSFIGRWSFGGEFAFVAKYVKLTF
jgi:hypothetical protein